MLDTRRFVFRVSNRRFHQVALISFAVIASGTHPCDSSQFSTLSSARPVFGLRNLGNTCYLNAQLQCAFHIPKVRSIILQGKASTGGDGDKDTPNSSRNDILESLQEVFRQLEEGTAAPRRFCASLGIPIWQQQDASEFWKLLLPALKCPPIIDLYQGSYEDYIQAMDGSGRERRREETFLDLPLNVQSSVEEALYSGFGKPEVLSVKEGNGWRPETNAEKVDAYKGIRLHTAGLPSILQLQLKRFHFDWNTETTSKINDRCTFPLELDLSKLCSSVDPVVYDLQAIVVHQGEFDKGHYYAYVRTDIRSNTWYRFNDETVEVATVDEVLQDSYGGCGPTSDHPRGGGLWKIITNRLFGSSDRSFGFGGPSGNAYIVQYVRRSDLDQLYPVQP